MTKTLLLAYLYVLCGAKFFRSFSRLQEELEEELRAAHASFRADDLDAVGHGRAAAERQARIEFGAREKFKEESYAALGANFLDSLAQRCAAGAPRVAQVQGIHVRGRL